MIVGLPCLLIKSLLFLHDDDNDHQHDHGQGEGFIENEMFAANVINQIGPSQIKIGPKYCNFIFSVVLFVVWKHLTNI